MMRLLAPLVCFACLGLVSAQPAFRLAPAVAVEAEEFVIDDGWKVVKNGEGNYGVDLVGFNHVSGERLLSLDARATSGQAHAEIDVPTNGPHRLWVRYESPPFTETRFRVVVEQNGKMLANQIVGKRDSVRYAGFSGKIEAKVQHDPPWGPEGLAEEVISIKDLQKGKATLKLLGVEQEWIPGRTANRNVDLIYLTSDVNDAWLKHYSRQTNLYPILDAVRDTRGPRWEVRFTNRGERTSDYRITHVYNRIPWGYSDPAEARNVAVGSSSDWIGLGGQDTAHFGTVQFVSSGEPFDVELRAVGGTEVVRKLSGGSPLRVYLPPYPGWGEKPTTPEETIDAILADLKKHPAPGKKPTIPLCFGGWMPLGQDNDYGRKYAELYVALGFRSMHPANSGPAQRKNLESLGIQPSKSWMVMGYRNPPTRANVDRARGQLARDEMLEHLRFYDYGDEIAFAEWINLMAEELAVRDKRLRPNDVIAGLWIDWLKTNRATHQLKDYWLTEWGPVRAGGFRPDSSANAARKNPRLYVDSLLFYEDLAIRFVAEGAKATREILGEDVLCGANYSCHPFYYPHTTAYVKWFRRGAAELGRHSEYFWQLAQLGPMVNGYVAEHFACGMRENPRAVLRQYVMPHTPGNTDGNFMRSAFTHLAHGATMLDFFGIGLPETFTENHVDHRAVSRYRAMRDVTHAVGFVEDLLPGARAVPSEVAILLSESTERWDHAEVAEDRAGQAHFGHDFRKTRLHFHMERLGIWKSLTLRGLSPDLVTEEDVLAGKLEGKKMLVLVGDHWPREMVPAIEKWVRDGGVAVATAASGQRDPYGEPMTDWHDLVGLTNVTTQQRVTFLRPRQELPFLKPLELVVRERGETPALATRERLEPTKECIVLARFSSDKSPACVERRLDKGRIVYLAWHPGLAFLWSIAQPPAVPDRGPTAHAIPRIPDEALHPIEELVTLAGLQPTLVASLPIDGRLLSASGNYLLPIANYGEELDKPLTLEIKTPQPIGKVSSAYHGELKHEQKGEFVVVTLPKLGYGDVLRLEKKTE